MWLLFAFLSAAFAALVAIFAKLGLKGVDTTLATTVRATIMAGFFVIASLLLGKFSGANFNSFGGKEWLFIVLSGIAGAFSWLFYFFALKEGTAGAVSAIDRLSIVFVVVLAALFLGEAMSWKITLGALLIAGGAVLIAF